MPGPNRTSRTQLALLIASVLAAAALLVGAVIVSYSLLHDDDSGAGVASPLGSIAIVGAEQTVFDWSRDACEPRDVPDSPARAFRDSSGHVQLIASHYVNRREVGPDLDHLTHRCEVILRSGYDPRPQDYDDREWIASTYTLDGRTINALVHEEYQGYNHPGACQSGQLLECWYNAITFARSVDAGKTYRQRPAPARLVATAAYRYVPDAGSYGLFTPSNIVRRTDGHYYFLARAGEHGAQPYGTCLLRTRDLAEPASWRGWDGSGFSVRFIDPYRQDGSPGDHTCTPVARDQIDRMSMSLTWNTYIDRYLLVGEAAGPSAGEIGFYYSTSSDLVHWSGRKLLRAVEAPWTFECGDRQPATNPSVLDPSSESRNFETTGRRPWLYFTRFRYSGCEQTLNRDLVRVRLELEQVPAR
jgi:hypothetical protein